MIDDWPKFLIDKQLASGKTGYYWNIPTRIAKQNPPISRKPLGTELAPAIDEANRRNAMLDYWLLHGFLPGEEPVEVIMIPGSFDHMVHIYMTVNQNRAKSFSKLTPSTQQKHTGYLKRFADYVLKDGLRVGQQLATDIDPPFVDAMYEKFVEGAVTGRSTNMMMAACRRAWNWSHRVKPDLFPKDNPFSKMGLDHSYRETVPATHDQLIKFVETAIALDKPELAFAARAAWDLLIRSQYIYEKLQWSHFRPSHQPDRVFLTSDKNKNGQWACLEDKQGALFYPELEDILAKVPVRGTLILNHQAWQGRRKLEGTFKPYRKRYFEMQVKEIVKAAGLPEDLTMAKFRHGGLTELGDAGLPDTFAQALSRHKQRGTLDRYLHRTDSQIMEANVIRRQFRQNKK